MTLLKNVLTTGFMTFFSTVYKSGRALSIDNVNVDAENANIWYVSIGGTCYQWDVTNSNYAVVK